MQNQPAVPLRPRRPPPLLLRHRTCKSCSRRSTAPLAGNLLPAMALHGHPPWPPVRKGEEGAPNQAATKLEDGAATVLAGRPGRQIRLLPPRAELEAAGSSQACSLPAAPPPWEGTGGGSRRGQSAGRRSSVSIAGGTATAPSRTSRPPDPAAVATGRARGRPPPSNAEPARTECLPALRKWPRPAQGRGGGLARRGRRTRGQHGVQATAPGEDGMTQ